MNRTGSNGLVGVGNCVENQLNGGTSWKTSAKGKIGVTRAGYGASADARVIGCAGGASCESNRAGEGDRDEAAGYERVDSGEGYLISGGVIDEI